MTLYDYPDYYSIAFSFRDISSEAEFIDLCIKGFSNIDVKKMLEIGCGPAHHAGLLTDMGYEYYGIDINPFMLEYARNKWCHRFPINHFLQQNMVDFDIHQKVDFIFIMLGSLYMKNDDDLNSHFNAISKHLKAGGLYFLDWCIQFNDPLLHNDQNDFLIEKDGITVESKFNIELIDKTQKIYKEIWTVNVDDHGQKKKFEMIENNLALFPQDFFKFINTRNDFEFVGWWRDWDFTKPINEDSEITRPIVLLRKK